MPQKKDKAENTLHKQARKKLFLCLQENFQQAPSILLFFVVSQVTPDGTYDPDRPKPEEPFGNLVALDPASSLLLQLPHALPGDALLRLHTERKSRESGGRLTERGRDTNRGRNDDSDGTATLQTDTTAKEEKAFPEDLTPLDIQEAEGGAWVRGKWMSDEEIDRAIQEGEQRIQPLVEEVQAEIEERERKQEERENAEEHPHFTDEEVDRMDLFEMKNELRLRGYRTAGPVETVRLRRSSPEFAMRVDVG
uniref:Uncharacterized protein n=1 Tax=Toxoplasma gondii TgCATBr9 TaxID=943120 RepID=A0A2T6IF89_TOXGO|nr:hypothetical protein TGBR9_282150A [Toxoplasma gondii TgCATBr9]